MAPQRSPGTAALAALLLAGCAVPRPATLQAQQPPAPPPDLQQMAALSSSELGGIRGGFDAGPGAELRFGFQQATYVNSNLVQTVMLPMVTLTGFLTAGGFAPATATLAAAVPAALPAPTASAVAGSPVLAIQGNAGLGTGYVTAGSGSASVVSMLGGGGLMNIVSNTANGQLVQQVTRIDLSTSGLSSLMQGARTPVLDAMRGLQSMPR